VVDTGTCVATTVEDVVGTVVAPRVVFPLPVQPAATASMTTATRLKVINKYELFIVFFHPFYPREYTIFRHKLY
jgi:hypothetical protein